MVKFYYNPKYKYTNRTIIDISDDYDFTEKNYKNIDSVDTINGHLIYVLEENETVPTYLVEDNGRRWFVSGITQLRTGKLQISLLRDIISEGLKSWKEEEAYISAGVATDYNKYKRWGLPFTNTKVGEERLNISGNSSYFVYYVNQQQIDEQNGTIEEFDLKIKQESVPEFTSVVDIEINNLNELPSFEYVNAGPVDNWVSKGLVKLNMKNFNIPVKPFQQVLAQTNGVNDTVSLNTDSSIVPLRDLIINCSYQEFAENVNNSKYEFFEAMKDFLNEREQALSTSIIPTNAIDNLSDYIGKVIKTTVDGKVYRINLQQTRRTYNELLSKFDCESFVGRIRNINYPSFAELLTNFTSQNDYFTFQSERTTYTYTLEELGFATNFDFTFKANVNKLPKSAVRCVNIVSNGLISDGTITQCLMLAQTNGINADNTTGRILDIQYLPFSIATQTNSNFKINDIELVAQFLDEDDYVYTTDLPDLSNINKETDTIKIVSPSRASQFLFRPYDNNGNMEFHTKITLKPYTSSIYVRPSTKGLLISDWDDKDCLIIQEDFSLTNVTSEWTQYVYNNRTYLNAFERQIQGREFEREWERKVEQAQARSDEWTARNISAQKAQTYTGNLPIISGVAGAIGTAWQDENYMRAAQLDREYNEALYQEGLSLSRDLFDYQLENIKSQPSIPSKVTTIDCKTLDGIYLEYYSTNDSELSAISNYYKYNGNRIDAYGTFSDYWGWFVKGKIIKSMYYTQPEIDELNRRLSMGIFTEVSYD